MKTELGEVWCGARPLIGTMIGVGILSLPFVVSRVGFTLGMLLLLVVACMSACVLHLYADLVLLRQGKARFIQVIHRELGAMGTGAASFAYLGSSYGALIAYLLFGGQFLRAVLYQWLPISVFGGSVWFFVITTLCTLGGSLFVVRMQRFLAPIFLGAFGILFVIAWPHIDGQNYVTFFPEHIGLPLGVMLFAFHGLVALPEMRDALGRHTQKIFQSIFWGVVTVTMVYGIFIFLVLGVAGEHTTENALLSLGNVLGPSAVWLASVIALCIALNAFVNLATAMVNTYTHDLRLRFLPAWMLTALPPLCLMIFGVQDLVSILGVTGGILGSLTSIMMLIAYERARLGGDLPRSALRVPQWMVALAFVMFVGVMVGTVVGVVGSGWQVVSSA